MAPRTTSGLYLKNADLVKEIDAVKRTYCSFSTDVVKTSDGKPQDYATYDIIVFDKSETKLPERKAEARLARAKRFHGINVSQSIVDAIPDTDLVFRVMTWEHIPEIPAGTKGAKKDPVETADFHVETNFVPFKHYILNSKGTPKEVGRSHWKGKIKHGHYCDSHGRISTELYRMFEKLVNHIATRANFSRYPYLDDMKAAALAQMVAKGLKFEPSIKYTQKARAKAAQGKPVQLNPFSYLTTMVNHAFIQIIKDFNKQAKVNNIMRIEAGLDPSDWYSAQLAYEADLKKRGLKLVAGHEFPIDKPDKECKAEIKQKKMRAPRKPPIRISAEAAEANRQANAPVIEKIQELMAEARAEGHDASKGIQVKNKGGGEFEVLVGGKAVELPSQAKSKAKKAPAKKKSKKTPETSLVGHNSRHMTKEELAELDNAGEQA